MTRAEPEMTPTPTEKPVFELLTVVVSVDHTQDYQRRGERTPSSGDPNPIPLFPTLLWVWAVVQQTGADIKNPNGVCPSQRSAWCQHLPFPPPVPLTS